MTSSSSRTIVYKGMLIATQLAGFYPDLRDPRAKSALALVHSRFSTNTFPSWELAHPYRMIAHNGEINTLTGNVNWMRARESQLRSPSSSATTSRKVLPVVAPGGSDSATFDNVLELLAARRPLAPARADDDDPRGLRRPRGPARGAAGFYAFHALPDGAVGRPRVDRVHRRPRDRRDARPQRPAPGALDGDQGRLVVLASETGVLDDAARARPAPGAPAARQDLPRRPRAGPHRRGRRGQARDLHAQALRRVVRAQLVHFDDLPPSRGRDGPDAAAARPPARLRLHPGGPAGAARRRSRATGEEPIGSMGNDLALAVLSDQRAAALLLLQAALRAGDEPADRPDPRGDRDERRDQRRLASATCSTRSPEHAHQLDARASRSCATASSRALRQVAHAEFSARTIDITWPVAEGAAGLERALERICARGRRGARRRRQHPHPLRPRARRRRARRSRRCSRSPPCTTTSCARARACRPGS